MTTNEAVFRRIYQVPNGMLPDKAATPRGYTNIVVTVPTGIVVPTVVRSETRPILIVEDDEGIHDIRLIDGVAYARVFGEYERAQDVHAYDRSPTGHPVGSVEDLGLAIASRPQRSIQPDIDAIPMAVDDLPSEVRAVHDKAFSHYVRSMSDAVEIGGALSLRMTELPVLAVRRTGNGEVLAYLRDLSAVADGELIVPWCLAPHVAQVAEGLKIARIYLPAVIAHDPFEKPDYERLCRANALAVARSVMIDEAKHAPERLTAGCVTWIEVLADCARSLGKADMERAWERLYRLPDLGPVETPVDPMVELGFATVKANDYVGVLADDLDDLMEEVRSLSEGPDEDTDEVAVLRLVERVSRGEITDRDDLIKVAAIGRITARPLREPEPDEPEDDDTPEPDRLRAAAPRP